MSGHKAKGEEGQKYRKIRPHCLWTPLMKSDTKSFEASMLKIISAVEKKEEKWS